MAKYSSDDVDLESKSKNSFYDPCMGYFYFTLFVLVNSIANSVQKVIFISHSSLNVFEMLLMRAVIVFFFMLYLMSGKLKELM